MKTDKELLMLAAKAAGYFMVEHAFAKNGKPEKCWCLGDYHYSTAWNPLIDDAQAFRLAVDLDVDLSLDKDNKTIQAAYWVDSINFAWKEEPFGNDKYAATRRAIVRAAATIGESMQ